MTSPIELFSNQKEWKATNLYLSPKLLLMVFKNDILVFRYISFQFSSVIETRNT